MKDNQLARGMKIKRQVGEIVQADCKGRAKDQNKREGPRRSGREQRCLGHKPKYFIRFSLLSIPRKCSLAALENQVAQFT